jgi:hypothetical protein
MLNYDSSAEKDGRVVKLADTLVLGTSAERRRGSSPLLPTTQHTYAGIAQW